MKNGRPSVRAWTRVTIEMDEQMVPNCKFYNGAGLPMARPISTAKGPVFLALMVQFADRCVLDCRIASYEPVTTKSKKQSA